MFFVESSFLVKVSAEIWPEVFCSSKAGGNNGGEKCTLGYYIEVTLTPGRLLPGLQQHLEPRHERLSESRIPEGPVSKSVH